MGSGIYMRAGSESRNKEGDNLLFITGYYSVKNKHLSSIVLKFPFNIHQCLKENFEARKRKSVLGLEKQHHYFR